MRQPRLAHPGSGDSERAMAEDGSRANAPLTHLTYVELYWDQGRIERSIRFGSPVEDQRLDVHRRLLSFAPGGVFALLRWEGNSLGTIVSRIDILRANEPRGACTSIGLIRPGGEVLLRQVGSAKVQQVLHQIEAIEQNCLKPEDICPDHWRHVHNRISAGLQPRAYDVAAHERWLNRQRIAP